jgi:hypothetical protein
MSAFFDWFETLGWQAALCFMFALCGFLVIVVLLADAAFRKLADSREERAILRQELKRRAEKRTYLQFPIERSRIHRKDIDPSYRSGRFHVPYSMADKKGLTK